MIVVTPEQFCACCRKLGIEFFTGVPDSLLQDVCAYISDHIGRSNHVIAANEGGAVAMAAGHYLATGNPALVYLQNSGQGNAANPLLSLADPDVYGIPMLLLVGWRGQPGGKDEPQHAKQGRVMNAVFTAMEIPFEVLGEDASGLDAQMLRMVALALQEQRPVALVVGKGTFARYRPQQICEPRYSLVREDVIELLARRIDANAALVATTGHISRELYECRMRQGLGVGRDFLTVGSMGHASQIALGIALAQPNRQVYCLDGDGAALMHMGAMPVLAQSGCARLRHIVLNNGVHGSVGGQPTVAFAISLQTVAEGCGYAWSRTVASGEGLDEAVAEIGDVNGPAFLEVRVSTVARADLGRPASTPADNKAAFMAFLGAQPRRHV